MEALVIQNLMYLLGARLGIVVGGSARLLSLVGGKVGAAVRCVAGLLARLLGALLRLYRGSR